jgi:hypothetical protein
MNMNDATKMVLLESTLKEILALDEEAKRGDRPGSMPLESSLSGELLYRWLDIRSKARYLLAYYARPTR